MNLKVIDKKMTEEEVYIFWKKKILSENYNTFHYQPYTNKDRLEAIERYESKHIEERDLNSTDENYLNFIKCSDKAFERLKQNNTEGKLFL